MLELYAIHEKICNQLQLSYIHRDFFETFDLRQKLETLYKKSRQEKVEFDTALQKQPLAALQLPACVQKLLLKFLFAPSWLIGFSAVVVSLSSVLGLLIDQLPASTAWIVADLTLCGMLSLLILSLRLLTVVALQGAKATMKKPEVTADDLRIFPAFSCLQPLVRLVLHGEDPAKIHAFPLLLAPAAGCAIVILSICFFGHMLASGMTEAASLNLAALRAGMLALLFVGVWQLLFRLPDKTPTLESVFNALQQTDASALAATKYHATEAEIQALSEALSAKLTVADEAELLQLAEQSACADFIRQQILHFRALVPSDCQRIQDYIQFNCAEERALHQHSVPSCVQCLEPIYSKALTTACRG